MTCVVLFRILGYDEEWVRKNLLDYDQFMRVTGGEALVQSGNGFPAHGLTVEGKP